MCVRKSIYFFLFSSFAPELQCTMHAIYATYVHTLHRQGERGKGEKVG